MRKPLDQSSLTQLTLWSEASLDPVSPSASRGNRRGPKTSATSGLKCHESSERSDPLGYSLRTFLASELSRLTSSLKTWKNRGTPAGRSWWVLMTSEGRTVVRGCGLSEGSDWPTPTSNESETRTNVGGSNGRVGPERPMLAGAVLRKYQVPLYVPTRKGDKMRPETSAEYWSRMDRHERENPQDVPKSEMWPTPHGMQVDNPRMPGPTGNELGRMVTKDWATPAARDWRSDRSQKSSEEIYGKKGRPLPRMAMESAGLLDPESPSANGKPQDWPTPTAHDGRRPGVDIHSTQGGNLSRDVAKDRATPQAHDATPGDPNRVGRYGTKAGGRNLNDETVATEWPTPRANRRGAPDSHGKAPIRGSLNPRWVSSLMGFPSDWLDSAPPSRPRTGGKP